MFAAATANLQGWRRRWRLAAMIASTLVIAVGFGAEARADEGDARLRSCISAGVVTGCSTDALLDNAYGVAVAPDGKNVYLTALNTNSVITYSPDPSTGELKRMTGANGCVRSTPAGGDCQDGRSMDFPSDIVVSPDGRNVYVAGYSADGIAIFDRNLTTGKLTQKAGTAGCVRSFAAEGCAVAREIISPIGLTVSADGRNVYSLQLPGTIVIFDRNTTTGAITQKAGEAGCVNNSGGNSCAQGRALGGFGSQLVLSPDGRHLYAPAPTAGGILLFQRDTPTGEIVQKPGAQGCITFDGSGGQCQDGSDNLGATKSVISIPPDATSMRSPIAGSSDCGATRPPARLRSSTASPRHSRPDARTGRRCPSCGTAHSVPTGKIWSSATPVRQTPRACASFGATRRPAS